MKKYIARFRQGSGSMAMNAIDYYEENGSLIRHSWANGGSTTKRVSNVPKTIAGYERLKDEQL